MTPSWCPDSTGLPGPCARAIGDDLAGRPGEVANIDHPRPRCAHTQRGLQRQSEQAVEDNVDRSLSRREQRPASSSSRRKRAVFYNAVGYAVELRLLASNPIDRIQWKTPAVAQTVDRRVVVGPAQARALLAAVRAVSDRGAHLEAFYACLYYAALRPSEAVMLRESDCHLPGRRWGRIDLAASAPRAGRDWTDDGTARQGPRPEAPRPARDPVHPHPARPGPDPPRPPQALRHLLGSKTQHKRLTCRFTCDAGRATGRIADS